MKFDQNIFNQNSKVKQNDNKSIQKFYNILLCKKTVTERKHWANRGKSLQMVTCLVKACVVLTLV